MITPTPPQAKVLAALQQHAVSIAASLATATQHEQRTGERPHRTWYDNFHHHATRREALSDVACAAGVPQAWIEHVRERGERGVRWNPDLYLRTPGPVDWDQVLGGLDNDVRRLQEWTALSVAHHRFGTRNGPGALGADLDRNVRTLYARTVGVANLLGLTVVQGQQLWGGEQDWVDAATAPLAGITSETLTQQWRQAAQTSLDTYSGQSAALADAGIPITRAPALPALEDLTTRISAAAPQPQPSLFLAPGTGEDIDNAINAASLNYGAAAASASFSEAPLFSDPADVQPWSGDPELDHLPAAPPIWQGIER